MVPLSLKTIFARWVDAMDRRDQGSAWVVTTAALAPTAQGVGTRQVNIAAGLYVANAGAFVNFAGGNKTPAAAAANPHVDLIYIDIAGVLQLAAGAEAVTNPVPPALPAGACPIALVYIAPGAVDYTALNLAYIFDVRVFYAPTFLPDGTIGAPSLPFGNEKTLGLYRVGAGVMGVSGSLALGTTPALSGVLRIPVNTNFSARNNANTADRVLARLTTTDQMEYGNASVSFDNATGFATFFAGASFGASPSSSGVLRVPNNQDLSSRNAANNGNVSEIYVDPSNVVRVGDAAVVHLSSSTGAAQIGTTPAAAGILRIPNNTVMRSRNAANSADIDLVSLNGSNKVVLGGQAPGSDGQVLTADSATTGGFKWATGSASTLDFQTFTGNGTWTKPGGTPRMVMVVSFGGGGGAGGGRGDIATANRQGGGAGGGGAYVIRWFDPSALGATETITIGAAGGGGAGGSSTNGANGTAGGNTSFGSHFSAFGGGFGAGGGVTNSPGGGGGGGGSIGAGGNGTTAAVGGAGGAPTYGGSSALNAWGYHGGDGGGAAGAGLLAEFAGAGGGGGSQVGSNGGAGGSSINGGPGGGGGGGVDSDTTARAGGAGGTIQSYTTGGGGAGGAAGGTNPGTAGTSRSLTGKAGSAGGGGGGSNVGTGGAGGAGGVPAAGGGGGAGGTTVGGAGAGGARGEMFVYTFF